ncbi:endolytic transglycosylase MltG [Garciella nitratireducens]|uniref:Endolytic murein transglycosylase n=1 Tax=Garciella nitratireducens DSM 15102 TaxID=1121911 RepID=A0A1T4K7X8_9FIRM|nr:endolytic transglycosylase MltG [Garciella nitratireducens]SJZ38550.1 UPF0755 protein [Garciella nitratireducens DSM 15102]
MKQLQLYRKKKSPLFIFIVFLLIFLIIISASILFYYMNLLKPINPSAKEKIIEIPKGYTVEDIAKLLEKEGIIKKDLAFEITVRLNNKQDQLKSGKYFLSGSMGVNEIIRNIVNGQTIDDTIKVTIPEGYELEMIADKMEKCGLVKKEDFIKAAQNIEQYDYPFLKNIPKDKNRKYLLEGYLFPDTYKFPKDVTEKEIIDTMLNRFNQVFKQDYYKRAEELDMTVDDIVTMASLIEREAKYENERALISGVYYKRLNMGMKLQCDATVQYALGERKKRLLYSDLEIDSPYNTYKYTGLPVGPISSVGEASIKAALYPKDIDYIYYVAKKDGSHVFSRTLKEHNKAKQEVLKD